MVSVTRGWTAPFFEAGWLTILFHSLFRFDHFFSCLMVIAPITSRKYIKWLELNHPSESLDTPPRHLAMWKTIHVAITDSADDFDDLGSSNTFINSPQGLANHQGLETTVSDHFDNIIPEAPLLQLESRQPTPSGQSSCSNPVVSKPLATLASTSHVSENCHYATVSLRLVTYQPVTFSWCHWITVFIRKLSFNTNLQNNITSFNYQFRLYSWIIWRFKVHL